MKKNLLAFTLVLVPIICSLSYFLWYAVDSPWFDDVEAIPAFVLDFLGTNDWSQKIELLLKPNNEHRILYTKLVSLLSVGLFGKINFIFLMLVGNLSIIGIFLLFWKVFKPSNISLWYFLPLSFLLFQPHYHLLSFWSITSLQHQPTAFFVFLAIYLLSKKQTQLSLVAAMVILLFTTFSMSNGMFAWVAGVAVLLFQKRWKASVIWLVFSGFSIFLYFRGFSTQANQDGFSFFFAHPFKTIFGFFAFVGGSADLIPSRFEPYRFGLPIVVGFCLILGFGLWFYQTLVQYIASFKQEKKPAGFQESFLLGAFAYILINALIVALLRPRFGFGVLVVSNYKLYPTLFLCLCYLAFLVWFKPRFSFIQITIIICMSLVFNVLSYCRFTPEVISRHKNLLVSSYNQAHNQVGLGAMVGSPLQPYIAKVMAKLLEKGLYRYPQYFSLPKPTIGQYPKINVEETAGNFTISCPDYTQQGSHKDDGLYYVLKSQKQTYLFASMPIPYLGNNPFRIGKGVVAFVQKPSLFSGIYEIAILEKKNGKTTLMATGKSILR